MYSHRQDDSRICGATTIVTGQDFVTIDGKLWAVEADPNTDGGGELIHSQSFVSINGKLVILANDSAAPDMLCPIPPHCVPDALGYSDLVSVSGGEGNIDDYPPNHSAIVVQQKIITIGGAPISMRT